MKTTVEQTVEVRQSDMSDSMQSRAISVIRTAFEQHHTESLRAVAEFIKKVFDAEYAAHWQCIIGRSFGSYVSHEPETFFFGYANEYAVMLFKTMA